MHVTWHLQVKPNMTSLVVRITWFTSKEKHGSQNYPTLCEPTCLLCIFCCCIVFASGASVPTGPNVGSDIALVTWLVLATSVQPKGCLTCAT
eukprot:4086664-Amphidinium_carterae.2